MTGKNPDRRPANSASRRTGANGMLFSSASRAPISVRSGRITGNQPFFHFFAAHDMAVFASTPSLAIIFFMFLRMNRCCGVNDELGAARGFFAVNETIRPFDLKRTCMGMSSTTSVTWEVVRTPDSK
jgi:hypothetical protein